MRQGSSEADIYRSLVKPRVLISGDLVAVVAPSAHARADDRERLDRAIDTLNSMGLRVRIDEGCFERYLFLAGNDRHRADQLTALFEDEQVRAIFCLRGGYGAQRILPLLDPGRLSEHPKILIGSSDVTSLLLFLVERCHLVAFHGPNLAGRHFALGLDSITATTLKRSLMSTEPLGEFPCRVLKPGYAKGPIVGGCLSNVQTTLGTPYQIRTEGRILFLEETNERPYRIDRMLVHIRHAGLFQGLRGVLFGDISGCEEGTGGDSLLIEVIREIFKDLPIPVLYGFPSGHGRECCTIPLGVPVVLDGCEGRVIFEESGVKRPSGPI